MQLDLANTWKKWLQVGLEDDSWQWDWTTLGCLPDATRSVQARVVAKADGVWAAEGAVRALELISVELGARISARSELKNGDRVEPGQLIALWEGPAHLVLALERPFLNLASYVCGIATTTRRMVDEIGKHWEGPSGSQPPRLVSTRKTLPGYRDLAVSGVIAGGGLSHRVSLSGGVLIKENHIAAAGGIERAIKGAAAFAPHGLLIECEVRNLNELDQAIAAGAQGVLLDNFEPALVRTAVGIISKSSPKTLVEVSGGIDLSCIGVYSMPGVHVISSGALTHSVKALDLSLLVD